MDGSEIGRNYHRPSSKPQNLRLTSPSWPKNQVSLTSTDKLCMMQADTDGSRTALKLFKKAIQQGPRRGGTGGVPSGVR